MANQDNTGNKITQQIEKKESIKFDETPQKTRINFWMISTFFFVVAFVTTFGYFTANSNDIKPTSTKIKNIGDEINESTATKQSSENQYPLPTYIGAGNYYQLYYVSDPETLDVKVYAGTREITPKVIELLELKNNGAEFGDVIWTRGMTNKAKFILSSHAGDSTKYYLLGARRVAPDLSGFKAIPASTLKFKNDFSDLPYFSYFRVLTWVGDEKILVEQTDIQKDDQTKQTVSYWIAPALNLDQKKIITP